MDKLKLILIKCLGMQFSYKQIVTDGVRNF